MKKGFYKRLITLLVLLSASLPFLGAGNEQVVFKFEYNRLVRLASNQYALWIEDSKGRFVTTVFVTSFTAETGFATREDTLPLWREKSNWEEARDERLDVVSGATPRGGDRSITWDLKDRNGNRVPAGNYTYKLEANVHWDKRILYTGTLRLKGKPFSGKAELTSRSDGIADREMLIRDLKVSYSP